MPLNFTRFGPSPDIKVFLLDAGGNYLSRSDQAWVFTADRKQAAVFHYTADRVAEQIDMLRRNEGLVLEAVPVPLDEIYESCDRSRELFMPSMVHFDGKQFLCADCRSRRGRPVRHT